MSFYLPRREVACLPSWTVFSSGSEYRCWVLKDESYLGFGPLKYRDLPSFRPRALIKEVDRSITSVALNIWALCNSPLKLISYAQSIPPLSYATGYSFDIEPRPFHSRNLHLVSPKTRLFRLPQPELTQRRRGREERSSTARAAHRSRCTSGHATTVGRRKE